MLPVIIVKSLVNELFCFLIGSFLSFRLSGAVGQLFDTTLDNDYNFKISVPGGPGRRGRSSTGPTRSIHLHKRQWRYFLCILHQVTKMRQVLSTYLEKINNHVGKENFVTALKVVEDGLVDPELVTVLGRKLMSSRHGQELGQ